MSLPGRISLLAGAGPVLAGRVQGALGRAELIGCGVVLLRGLLSGGLGAGQLVLGGGQAGAQRGELADRLAAGTRVVCHTANHPR